MGLSVGYNLRGSSSFQRLSWCNIYILTRWLLL
nr:MAG TPA: hypothetical protein [Caudoviricetes sp.]